MKEQKVISRSGLRIRYLDMLHVSVSKHLLDRTFYDGGRTIFYYETIGYPQERI